MKEFVAVPCTTDLYELGECCRWDDVRSELCWVDVPTGRFFRARVNAEVIDVIQTYDVGATLTSFAPMENRGEGWIVALGQSIALLDESGGLDELVSPEAHNATEVRMNDGIADPWGSFWVGSMAYNASRGRGSLYRYHESSGVTLMKSSVTISNGLGWSLDARIMYYVDSGPGTVYAFDVDELGEITGQRIFLQFDVATDGTPDGLCVDQEGAIWLAMWGGYEVRCYSGEAEQLARVRVPTAQPSCCTIGGVNGTTLYITTAREDMANDVLKREPDAGRLFSVDVQVEGKSIDPYRRVVRVDEQNEVCTNL